MGRRLNFLEAREGSAVEYMKEKTRRHSDMIQPLEVNGEGGGWSRMGRC